jgi:succinoglycan biosynthesis transport protein ExoP
VRVNRTESLDYNALLRGIWRRHKFLVAATFLGLAIPLLVIVYFTHTPLYFSTGTIYIEPQFSPNPFYKEESTNDNSATSLALLRSRSLSEAVVGALPTESLNELLSNPQYTDYRLVLTNMIKGWMGKPPTVLSPQQRAIAELQNARMSFGRSQSEFRESPRIFDISATSSNPRVAMDLVNAYIQLLVNRTRMANQEETRRTREFLEQLTQQAKGTVAQAEDTLAKFEQQKGRIKLSAESERELFRYSQAENDLAETQANREVVSSRIAKLRQSLDQARSKEAKEKENRDKGAADARAETLGRFSAFKAAQDNLAKLEAKYVDMLDRYTEENPLVQTTLDQVTQARARVARLARELPTAPSANEPQDPLETAKQLSALQTQGATLQAREDALKLQLDRSRTNLRGFNKEEIEYSNLRRTVDSNRSLLAALTEKLMGARIREQGDFSIVRIIDPASLPLQPTQTKTQRLALMVLALAGGVAFGVAFGIEYWRQPIETDSDVEGVTGLPVLGQVGVINTPNVNRSSRRKAYLVPLPIHLPSSTLPTGIHMDLYRAIRATVEAERLKARFSTILVSSPGPNEGKSTTILNLAHVFQEFGRRVLVIEADLRRPLLHRSLSLSDKPGLVDFLHNAATFEQVCRKTASGFTVIPGQVAREDAAGLLASSRIKELLDLAAARFDLILADSAPMLAVPDNLLLVTAFDRVILVVRASKTSKRELRKVESMLERANANLLGVILNEANRSDVHYYDHRYRKYYKAFDTKTPQETHRQPRSSSLRAKR